MIYDHWVLEEGFFRRITRAHMNNHKLFGNAEPDTHVFDRKDRLAARCEKDEVKESRRTNGRTDGGTDGQTERENNKT